MKAIVFLNLAVMPYHVALFRALIAEGFLCVVYWWGKAPRTSYRAPELEGLVLVNRFAFHNEKMLFEDVLKREPLCVVSAGWLDKGYNYVCAWSRKRGIITLAVSDTQWRGGGQWANRLLAPFRHRRWFNYIWAAGVLQYDYARKLGFSSSRILLNCFSADMEKFLEVPLDRKKTAYPRRFLFVGRFVEEKGIDVLLKAWEKMSDKKGWTLELIGDGPLKKDYKECYADVVIKDFMSQEALCAEAAESGCFILPSRFEPWALVIQEFAAAGLPIICTNRCGASRHFVLNGYNGYIIDAERIGSLIGAMRRIVSTPHERLVLMAERSRDLARTVTPDYVANTLLSIL